MKFAETLHAAIPICSKCNKRMVWFGYKPDELDQWYCQKCWRPARVQAEIVSRMLDEFMKTRG